MPRFEIPALAALIAFGAMPGGASAGGAPAPVEVVAPTPAPAAGGVAPALAADAGPIGYWLTGKKGVMVQLSECSDAKALCGRIVWLKKPVDKSGALRRDAENPDPALRKRPWCGIEVVSGLRPAGEGVWKGGALYNPKNGQSYGFSIREKGERLKVRAFVGIEFLGKSETWERAANIGPGCPTGAAGR